VLSTKDASDPAGDVATLTTAFLKDFVGEEVALTLNAMGEVALADTSTDCLKSLSVELHARQQHQ